MKNDFNTLQNDLRDDSENLTGSTSSGQNSPFAPYPDNGLAGPDSATPPDDDSEAPEPEEWENADGDNDLNEEGEYESDSTEDDEDLMPIEQDDDDSLEDDEEIDPMADRPTTFESDANFSKRPHGRTTGTMTDHEPGLPGSNI